MCVYQPTVRHPPHPSTSHDALSERWNSHFFLTYATNQAPAVTTHPARIANHSLTLQLQPQLSASAPCLSVLLQPSASTSPFRVLLPSLPPAFCFSFLLQPFLSVSYFNFSFQPLLPASYFSFLLHTLTASSISLLLHPPPSESFLSFLILSLLSVSSFSHFHRSPASIYLYRILSHSSP